MTVQSNRVSNGPTWITRAVVLSLCIAAVPGCQTTPSAAKANKFKIFSARPDVPPPYTSPAVADSPSVPMPEPGPAPTGSDVTVVARPQLVPLPEAHVQSVDAPVAMITEPVEPIARDPKALPEMDKVEPLTYTVKKGDTLWDIARMYGITSKELASFNDIGDPNSLKIGATLQLPPGSKFVPLEKRPPVVKKKPAKSHVAPTEAKKSAADMPPVATHVAPAARESLPEAGKYTVAKDDSLWKISRKFGISIQELKTLNNLHSDLLQPGQVLVLRGDGTSTATAAPGTPPAGDSAAPAAPGASEAGVPMSVPAVDKAADGAPAAGQNLKNLPHYVAQGDTLDSIAEMYRSKVEWIINANPAIKTNEDLKVGKEILVPCPNL